MRPVTTMKRTFLRLRPRGLNCCLRQA